MTLLEQPRLDEGTPDISEATAPGPQTRRSQRARKILDDRGLVAVLGLAIVWSAVMYLHVWRRHDRYGTFDNDLGFHDQFVWLLARGESFSSVLGLHAFGHNATFGYFLLAPFSWIGMGPQGLNLILTIVVALGAVPLYLLARDLLEDTCQAVAVAGCWLLHPVVQGNVWETFHPEAMAMAPLLAAYLCSRRRRWGWFASWVALAMVWKADVAMVVAVLGVLIACRGHRRVGGTTVAVAVVWFVVTIGWMIPHFSGGGTVFGPLYGDLGETPTDVATTALRDPAKVASRAWDHDPVRYSRDLLAPYAFVPLGGGGAILMAAPQAVVNLLSEMPFTREWRDNHHYQAIPMVAMAIAMVEGLARLKRRRRPWAGRAVGAVVATSLAATAAWGSLPPLTTQFAHYWPADNDPARPAKDTAVAIIPPDAPVVAHYLLVPHLTHRRVVYSYPNPWRQVFYGVEGTELPDPATVDYLAMDTNLLPPDGPDRELWDCIMGSKAFDEVFSDQGIAVFRRVEGRDRDRDCR